LNGGHLRQKSCGRSTGRLFPEQVLLDAQDGDLRFSLLDMKDGGAAGDAVRVAANGTCTLPGCAGSDLTSLEVRVNRYSTLAGMVRSPYGGRLVDILDVRQGS
jgi:hypothetical protein